jgi:uncharacterized membrane protein YfcA
VAIAAAVGGMVNAIAGGGTLLTFPALIALGVPPLVANATSTVALWPGALSSMYGYRAHLRGLPSWAMIFAVPSLLGGLCGAWFSSTRRKVALKRSCLARAGRRSCSPSRTLDAGRAAADLTRRDDGRSLPRCPIALIWQFLVCLRGYFGAIGILDARGARLGF